MTIKHLWTLATAALAAASCSSDAGITTSAQTADTPAQQMGETSAATPKDASSASPGSTMMRATDTSVGSTTSGSKVDGNGVSTGSSTTQAGAGATAAMAGSGAMQTMTGSTGPTTAGVGGTSAAMGMEDDDAGVPDGPGAMDGESTNVDAGMPTSGMGAAGMGGAAGSAGAAATGSGEGQTTDIPTDTGARGPWPVGVRTVSLELGAGLTPVEVWYPARPGSESERQTVSYDLTAWLPPEHGIPTSAPKVHIECDCYRDLPPDTEHGPFPIVVVVHGQASFRAAFASEMSHWASRGFIAIAADHPGLVLRDALAGNGGCSGTGIIQDYAHARDVPALFRALALEDGIFSFLDGALDLQRVALGGHGDGAAYAADNAAQPGVTTLLSFSDDTVLPSGGSVAAAFFLSGMSDKIIAYNNVVRAAENTARNLRPTVLAGMANVGHLGFTDLCGARNSDGQDAIAMARRYDICGGAAIDVVDQYFWDCPLSPLAGSDNYLDQDASTALARKLSTLALEEFLLDLPRRQVWNDLAADGSWGELRQSR